MKAEPDPPTVGLGRPQSAWSLADALRPTRPYKGRSDTASDSHDARCCQNQLLFIVTPPRLRLPPIREAESRHWRRGA